MNYFSLWRLCIKYISIWRTYFWWGEGVKKRLKSKNIVNKYLWDKNANVQQCITISLNFEVTWHFLLFVYIFYCFKNSEGIRSETSEYLNTIWTPCLENYYKLAKSVRCSILLMYKNLKWSVSTSGFALTPMLIHWA